LKKYTKLYLDFFGYTIDDVICCEVCGRKSVDIHHISARGMGGSEEADRIENLMAVCRECHIIYGDKKQHIEFLKEKHQQFIYNYGKIY
jgi:5-methylcytosine-specific restriction endonuclease McrA